MAMKSVIFRKIKKGYKLLLRNIVDLYWVFRKKKILVVSWCEYDGCRLMHRNWGDDINVYFLEYLLSCHVGVKNLSFVLDLFPATVYSCIGSIIGTFNYNKLIVWGSGLICDDWEIKVLPFKVLSVRGPLTRQSLLRRGINCPEKYGDPALLISRYYRPAFEKQYEIGIIAHYKDDNNLKLLDFCEKHPDVLLIKMQGYNEWFDIPKQVCKCKRIMSSSLHGLILADSYRVPNLWVRFSDKIQGGDFKYQDYFQSVGRRVEGACFIKDAGDIEKAIESNRFSLARISDIDFRAILDTCPFRERIKDYDEIITQIPYYESFEDKESHYDNNYYLNTEEEFRQFIKKFLDSEQLWYYRGVNEAKYKLFTSSQRHWCQRTDWVARYGEANYYEFVESIVRKVEELDVVQEYIIQHHVNTNDMFLLTLLQHFNAPSPIMEFSENLLAGLYYAADWNEDSWVDTGKNEISDYISLYYVDKSIECEESSVQKYIMDDAETKQFDMVNGNSVDDKETEDNILRLRYRQFRPDKNHEAAKYITLGASGLGKTQIENPITGFQSVCENLNDFLVRQNGLLIMNNTEDEPLVEVVNRQTQQKMFNCVNIHKSLMPIIRKAILTSDKRVQRLVDDIYGDKVSLLRNAITQLV